MARKCRANKSKSVSESLANSEGFKSDQNEVWDGIAALHASAKTSSATGAMHDVFKAREDELRQCLQIFVAVPGQTGLLVVMDGELAGFDLIPQPEVYAHQHSKLVKSYVIDALAERQPKPANAATATNQARTFLRDVTGCPERTFPSVGHGIDCRYQKPGLAGSALVHEEKVVHTAFFGLPATENSAKTKSASVRNPRRRSVE
jgi:hypothetical protein